jgi:predicted MPP superfamily phosphohydrolase
VPEQASETQRAPRGPRPGRRARFFLFVLVIAIGLQVPLLWALGQVTGHLGALIAAAGVLTVAFLSGLFDRSAMGNPGPRRLYLIMWPFFVYWTAALFFAFAGLFVMGVGALVGLPRESTLGAALAATAAITLLAFVHRVRIVRRDVPIASLPEAFDGYRIVQISDLHCGPFASGRRVSGWVRRVNSLEADVVAVTGDLIASGTTFVSVVASALGGLTARDGVFAAMGNHDYFGDGEHMARALGDAGLSVLRNEGVELLRDGARIFVAGVDDTWTGRDDVDKALARRPRGVPTVLLAHDPVLFTAAAARGVDLTLSGHTHGGQLGVPFFARRWNLARVITRFTTDLYREGQSMLYVNRGLGTTGVPIRMLVAPEIAVLTLRRAA